jgi:hypothetical protein
MPTTKPKRKRQSSHLRLTAKQFGLAQGRIMLANWQKA